MNLVTFTVTLKKKNLLKFCTFPCISEDNISLEINVTLGEEQLFIPLLLIIIIRIK